jgi:NAD(P)H-dependent FMN reductase
MYKEYPAGQAPETLERLAGLVKSSDAVVVVSGEYNHSIQPALSNLLDHFLEEWFWRPSAIACYSAGQFGGVRAAMQLRALLPEIGMPITTRGSWRFSRFRICSTSKVSRGPTGWRVRPGAFSTNWSGMPVP